MKISNILWHFLPSPAVLSSALSDFARIRWLNSSHLLRMSSNLAKPYLLWSATSLRFRLALFPFSSWRVLLLYNVERRGRVTWDLPEKRTQTPPSQTQGSVSQLHSCTPIHRNGIPLQCVFHSGVLCAWKPFAVLSWWMVCARGLTVACSVLAATSGDSNLKLLSDVAQTVKGQGTIAWVNCG